MQRALLIVALLLVDVQSTAIPQAQAPTGSRPPATPRTSIEIFPGATVDPAETAAVQTGDRRATLYRTPSDFDIVVNYYRFKRKQPVDVVEEDVGARFERLAELMTGADPAPALLDDPFVRRFHQFALGTTRPDLAAASVRWRQYADRFKGVRQRIGEGTRVTIYRPYLSPRTFSLVNDTVIVLRNSGGTGTW